jgi:hypothetical protein
VPAAAVIPAPIAYIKVVAVKRLVVELLVLQCCPVLFEDVVTPLRTFLVESVSALYWVGFIIHLFYCEKNKVLKAGFTA